MKRMILAAGAAAVLAVVGLVAWRAANRTDVPPKAEPPPPQKTPQRPSQPVSSVPRKIEPAPPAPAPEPDTRLADALAKAAASEDAQALLKLLEQVRASPDADLRQDAVDALIWLGADYLPELMSFTADPDEEVREAALDGCELFIDAIEDESLRARTIKALTTHLTDPDMLETAFAKLESVKESLALEVLGDVLKEGSSAAREAAKAEFESLTGDAFTSFVQLQKERHRAMREEREDE